MFTAPMVAFAQADTVRESGGRAHDSLLIVVLGSSTAKGGGVSHPDSSWVRRYERALRLTHKGIGLKNLSQWAHTSYHFLPSEDSIRPHRPTPDSSRNITAALALRPSAIIVNLPSNDAAAGFDSSEQRRNYVRILEAAGDIPVWFCTPQPRVFTDSTRTLQDSMALWLKSRFPGRIIDFNSGLASSDGSPLPQYDSGDGVHLNDAAHRILFDRILAADIPGALRRGPSPASGSAPIPAATDP